ncbi:hypothetical protein N8275_12445, partial [Pseudomonadales bacterium]|nr:hypothetical protein [Pseudomonadales bacterium]
LGGGVGLMLGGPIGAVLGAVLANRIGGGGGALGQLEQKCVFYGNLCDVWSALQSRWASVRLRDCTR